MEVRGSHVQAQVDDLRGQDRCVTMVMMGPSSLCQNLSYIHWSCPASVTTVIYCTTAAGLKTQSETWSYLKELKWKNTHTSNVILAACAQTTLKWSDESIHLGLKHSRPHLHREHLLLPDSHTLRHGGNQIRAERVLSLTWLQVMVLLLKYTVKWGSLHEKVQISIFFSSTV